MEVGKAGTVPSRRRGAEGVPPATRSPEAVQGRSGRGEGELGQECGS